jgi:hypothetical protein
LYARRLIASPIPKRQFLIKNHEIAKVANLEVDPKSYWLYTNDPFDNRRRAEAFEQHGFERGLACRGRPRQRSRADESLPSLPSGRRKTPAIYPVERFEKEK